MSKEEAPLAEPVQDEFHIRVVSSFDDIRKAQWDRLSGASKTSDTAYNPFISYDYLSSLEESGCAVAKTGWLGQHLLLEHQDATLSAAMPCYLKSHSQGEYVFDHAWADAFERAGGSYYPKLQSSVPFTPATGPRLLTTETSNAGPMRAALAEGLKTLTRKHNISSAHVTFLEKTDADVLTDRGFLLRTDQQFQFINRDFAAFDDFLQALSSRKRKAVKRERRDAQAEGVTIEWLTGNDLTEGVWDEFFGFYMDTASRKWGRPYLNRAFFSLIGEKIPDDILLIMARRDGRYIAGAINFIGGDCLYGRHWGCLEPLPFLHFEICYYQAIDYAIEHGLGRVEAGAQGQHKLARGYVPVETRSAHYIPHKGFRDAVEDYLVHERSEVSAIGGLLAERSPFRKQPK